MLPALHTLIALQALDTAAETRRRRLAELPAAERDIQTRIAAATAAVDIAKTKLTENQHARRDLEKQVAQVDTRLARFDDHKAAVKTNQEFTALLHEISTARTEKDGVEEQILVLLEAADAIAAEVKAAEATLADAKRDGAAVHAVLEAERGTLNAELGTLLTDRARDIVGVPPPLLAKYEQLLKQRRMIAVAVIDGESCTACHVRLRPAVAGHVRRNDTIIQCDSCQRILYAVVKEPL